MARWSVRSREGPNTPSLEELFWFHVTPGGFYRVGTAEEGTESEEFDYMVISGLTWYAGICYAADAAAAAQMLGTTNMVAEWKLAHTLTKLRLAADLGRAMPIVLLPAAVVAGGMAVSYDMTQATASNLAVVSGTPGAQPSKPWWMPMAVYYAMYS